MADEPRDQRHPSVKALPQTPAIYLITNELNGKLYVGQALNLRRRWYWHRNAANGEPSSSYAQKTALARAMRKHGVGNFSVRVLEESPVEQLNEREVFWIAEMGSMAPGGYNLTSGGKPARRAAEVGARISAANKGRAKTPEWRAKLSAAHKGKVLSPETRAKISAVQRGRKQSPESKAKRSAALKGVPRRPRTLAEKDAIRAGMTSEGKARSKAAAHTPEAIEKRRLKNLGRKRTPEQKARIEAGKMAAKLRRSAAEEHANG